MIRPGEFDGIYDELTLSLLRLQVAPEPLLMICDVDAPAGASKKTILLTKSKTVFVGLSKARGQMSILDRREIELSAIDSIAVNTSAASSFVRETHTIQIVSRAGIERWKTIFSSGPRIVRAALALKRGEDIQPFIRIKGELAASAAPPTFKSARFGRFKLPRFDPRFINNWVMAGGNPASKGLRLMSVIAIGFVGIVGVLLLFVMVLSLFDLSGSHKTTPSSQSSPNASTDDVPTVTVSGMFADKLQFDNWHWEGAALVGEMQFVGDSTLGFGGCGYRFLKDGVVQDSGTLSIPAGSRGETVKVRLLYPSRDRSGLSVEIVARFQSAPSLP